MTAIKLMARIIVQPQPAAHQENSRRAEKRRQDSASRQEDGVHVGRLFLRRQGEIRKWLPTQVISGLIVNFACVLGDTFVIA